jgi:hypothetical protein
MECILFCMCVCACVCLCMCVCMRVFVYVCVYVCVCWQFMRTCIESVSAEAVYYSFIICVRAWNAYYLSIHVQMYYFVVFMRRCIMYCVESVCSHSHDN